MIIERTEYLSKLIEFKDKSVIKIVTGVRRCGKSTLFELYKDYLKNNGLSSDQFIHINFETLDNKELLDTDTLYQYINERLTPSTMNYIFLDEIQYVNEFEKVINSLHIKKNVDVYVTGSNDTMLSGEISTLISGRYVEISMLPLSFKEYVSAFDGNVNKIDLYYDYLEYSGFPYAIEFNKNMSAVRDYLIGILNTVLLKDVATRRNISDVMMLQSLVDFMFDNIGNITSTKKIADTMTSDGRKITTPTVESYLTGLIDSFLLYRAKRYDIKGKQYLRTNDKYYVVDIGLKKCLLGSSPGDYGHELENVVYLELLRRGFEVYVGKINEYEVDFVTIKSGKKSYYQVAYSIAEKNVLERELYPLYLIRDSFPKYLITMDPGKPTNVDGIIQMNIIDFLLDIAHEH